MITRRRLLQTSGLAAGGLLAGCTLLSRGAEGYVQLKSVAGQYTEDGQQYEEDILRVSLSSPPGAGSPTAHVQSERWADRFDSPATPVVSDGLHDDLTRAYERVRYVVGVCSPAWADDDDETVGCSNVATNRANFNTVQVHDKVRASSDGLSLTIHEVDGEWEFDRSNGAKQL